MRLFRGEMDSSRDLVFIGVDPRTRFNVVDISEEGLRTREMTLNRAQSEAVHTPCNSVLQILAGPGSGKTKVLTHRVCFLLQQGIPPENIILTTFTNVFLSL